MITFSGCERTLGRTAEVPHGFALVHGEIGETLPLGFHAPPDFLFNVLA
jgi:hypothetical protein